MDMYFLYLFPDFLLLATANDVHPLTPAIAFSSMNKFPPNLSIPDIYIATA